MPHSNQSKRSLAGSPRFRPRLLGFLRRLVGFCCLLYRALLRFILIGSFRFGLATTGLAAVASSVVFAYACATTFLAMLALSVVLAYASTTALLAMIASPPVFAPPTNTHLLEFGL